MSLLELRNVSYKYKKSEQSVISGINCEFEQGKLYAIVGPSGSGKSTLLSLLSGLDSPTDGDILFDEENLLNLDIDKYRRENISMIFQAFHLFPTLTLLENVCYPMELCGVQPHRARKRAQILLETVGITSEQMERYPSKISGGEQQRVAIARSLATNAKIILADEPTGNLDTVNTEGIVNILKTLVREGNYCVIVVTHDMEIAKVANVVYKMKNGMLISE